MVAILSAEDSSFSHHFASNMQARMDMMLQQLQQQQQPPHLAAALGTLTVRL